MSGGGWRTIEQMFDLGYFVELHLPQKEACRVHTLSPISPLSQYFLQELPAGMHVRQAHVPVAHKRPSRATRTSLLFIWRTANRRKTLPHCTATSHCLHKRLERGEFIRETRVLQFVWTILIGQFQGRG